MGRVPTLLVAAGEVSGDRMAAPVVRALSRRLGGLRAYGFGGEALGRAGVELLAHERSLSAVGLGEALVRAPAVAGLARRLGARILRQRPDLALLVDYPGLNLRLGRLLRGLGVPVLHYGAPQRWAWLGWRGAAVGRAVDRLAVTLPFEEAWYCARGVPARYVGHPAVERFAPLSREAARARLGLRPGGDPLLALLPGSRPQELARHLPLLRRTLALLGAPWRAVLALPPGPLEDRARALWPALPPLAPADEALCAADLALCASGTVTLEAALAGVPAAVFYRLSRPSYWAARALLQVEHIALPNLILGRRLLPELHQDQATPEALAAEARRLLRPAERRRIRRGLAELRRTLGPAKASENTAALALELLAEKRSGLSLARGGLPRR